MTEEELDRIANERMGYCPFCPVKPKIEERYLFKLEYILHCPQCGLTMKSHSLEDLIRQWNTRHYPKDLIKKSDVETFITSSIELISPATNGLDKVKMTLDNTVEWLHKLREQIQ